jgi:hypothetical protein
LKTATQAKNKPTRPTAFITVDTFPDEGWYLLAYFRTSRARIVQAFGPPNAKLSDPGKRSNGWLLKTPKGEIAAIYDERADSSLWHIGAVQLSTAEEIGEALGVPIEIPRCYVTKEAKVNVTYEAARRRLAEIVEPDGLATGIFKLPVGDRNPVEFGVNEDDYRRVLEGGGMVFERPSGRLRALRWADYREPGVVGLIFVDGEDDLTGRMYQNFAGSLCN